MRHCTGETPISEEIPTEEMLPTGVEWDRMVFVGDGFVFLIYTGWLMENPIKMDDLGVPLFSETSICMLYLGGGFSRYFLCSPLPSEMIQFDEHIFQMDWFNHQLVYIRLQFEMLVWESLRSFRYKNMGAGPFFEVD